MTTWPYKHPFAELEKKSDLITAQMRKKTFCANRIFFNQKYFLTNSLGWKSVTLNPQMRQTLFAKIVFSQKSVTHTVLAIPRNLFSHPEKSGHSITTESKPEKGYIFKNNIQSLGQIILIGWSDESGYDDDIRFFDPFLRKKTNWVQKWSV